MSVQSINATLMNVPQILPKLSGTENSHKQGLSSFASTSGNTAGLGLVLTSEKYSSNSMVLDYKNADGDSVILSTQSIEYQKAMLSANGINSEEDWKKLVDYLKEQYTSLKEEIIKGFLKSNGQEVSENKTAADSGEIAGLPEYWNAENTSQRIVDFATSFLGAFKGSGEEFLSMIKDAIEKGFAQAKDIMGDLPDAVGKLVNTTHDLTMKKLDAWAAQQGIATDTAAENQAVTAAA
jgi:hypothetical protein